MAYKKSQVPNLAEKLKKIKTDTVAYVNSEIKKFANQECAGFKAAIKAQDFEAFHRRPLSAARLAEKAAAGADLRVMIATHHYVNSIRVFFRKSRNLNGGTFRIGFHHNAHARTLDGAIAPILLQDVARIQENGSRARKLPPRPHWGPYLRDMVPRATVFRARLTRRMVKRLKAQIAKVH